jgi:hypothetical protein
MRRSCSVGWSGSRPATSRDADVPWPGRVTILRRATRVLAVGSQNLAMLVEAGAQHQLLPHPGPHDICLGLLPSCLTSRCVPRALLLYGRAPGHGPCPCAPTVFSFCKRPASASPRSFQHRLLIQADSPIRRCSISAWVSGLRGDRLADVVLRCAIAISSARMSVNAESRMRRECAT